MFEHFVEPLKYFAAQTVNISSKFCFYPKIQSFTYLFIRIPKEPDNLDILPRFSARSFQNFAKVQVLQNLNKEILFKYRAPSFPSFTKFENLNFAKFGKELTKHFERMSKFLPNPYRQMSKNLNFVVKTEFT